jgi:hypothetical protein
VARPLPAGALRARALPAEEPPRDVFLETFLLTGFFATTHRLGRVLGGCKKLDGR